MSVGEGCIKNESNLIARIQGHGIWLTGVHDEDVAQRVRAPHGDFHSLDCCFQRIIHLPGASDVTYRVLPLEIRYLDLSND